MIFVLLYLFMLALAYKLYLVKKEPYFSALLFSIPLSIIGLIMGNELIGVFVGSAILFALAFTCFWLLEKVPNGTQHYAVLSVTAIIIIMISLGAA